MSAVLAIQNREETDEKVIDLTVTQARFILTETRYPAYVASWGTGKTMTGIGKIKRLAEYPHNLILVGRKEFTDLKDSTIKDFEEYMGMKVDSQREVVFPNGTIIMFRHLEELHNIQNINLGAFWIEQAEELETDDIFFKLHGRLRRKGPNCTKDCRNCDHPGKIERSGFITANTNGHNWIYKLWKAKKEDPDYALFEANSFEAEPYIPADTLDSWKKLKSKKPTVYNRFVMNSWDESDTIDIIIQPSWVQSAAERPEVEKPLSSKGLVSIDVARYGDDKTIFYAIENNQVKGREEHEKKSTMEVVGLATRFARKHGLNAFAVDEIGVGAGVADRLKELGSNVVFVNSSNRSSEPDTYYNLRAEIYSKGADLFEQGRVKIQSDDSELIEQLSWAKYKTIKSNGIYQVEAKDDIKKRYGRSPDNADCLLNGLWALSKMGNRTPPPIQASRRYAA